MFGLLIIRDKAHRPQKKLNIEIDILSSTSPLRLDLVPWYTSGYQ